MTMHRPNRTIDDSPISLGLIFHLLEIPGTTLDSGAVTCTDAFIPGLLWEFGDIGTDFAELLVDGETLLHILACQDEDRSTVEVDDQVWPLHPGDSIFVGGSPTVSISAGVLMLLVQSDRTGSSMVTSPSHGTETFDGFNRRTTYETGQYFTFERWKLTQPQTIAIDTDRAVAIVGLFGNISCIDGGTIETVRAGESLVVNEGRVRLIPDGLAYVALISVDLS